MVNLSLFFILTDSLGSLTLDPDERSKFPSKLFSWLISHRQRTSLRFISIENRNESQSTSTRIRKFSRNTWQHLLWTRQQQFALWQCHLPATRFHYTSTAKTSTRMKWNSIYQSCFSTWTSPSWSFFASENILCSWIEALRAHWCEQTVKSHQNRKDIEKWWKTASTDTLTVRIYWRHESGDAHKLRHWLCQASKSWRGKRTESRQDLWSSLKVLGNVKHWEKWKFNTVAAD